jgi:heme/copper-type cytochrome/quinol oxidase subunit 2
MATAVTVAAITLLVIVLLAAIGWKWAAARARNEGRKPTHILIASRL